MKCLLNPLSGRETVTNPVANNNQNFYCFWMYFRFQIRAFGVVGDIFPVRKRNGNIYLGSKS